jgi:hypothetical protein
MNYAIDKARIAHQTVDGEVIVIDFVNAAYYSVRDTVAEIWLLLAAAVPLDERLPAIKKTIRSWRRRSMLKSGALSWNWRLAI